MIAKWIVCRTGAETRARFSEAQKAWSAVAGLTGFRGQFGGFEEDDAHIVALWEDDDSSGSFMRAVHDDVAAESGQSRFYTSIDVAWLDRLVDLPGRFPDLPAALRSARYLRVADCTVREGRADAFVETERSVWRPGMAAAEGMLAGAFWSFRGRPHRYLVTTLWSGEDAHADYVRTRLPLLRKRARPEDDLVAVAGHALPLLPAWTVLPRSGARDQKL